MIGVRDGQEVSEDKEVLSCPPTLSTQGIDLKGQGWYLSRQPAVKGQKV